jgi:hypothetical protein
MISKIYVSGCDQHQKVQNDKICIKNNYRYNSWFELKKTTFNVQRFPKNSCGWINYYYFFSLFFFILNSHKLC